MVNTTVTLRCDGCRAREDCVYHKMLRHVTHVYSSSIARQLTTTDGITDLDITLTHVRCVREGTDNDAGKG